jgi:hypothetical protein
VGEDKVLEEAGGLWGVPLLPDLFEELTFTLVLAGIEGANHTDYSV